MFLVLSSILNRPFDLAAEGLLPYRAFLHVTIIATCWKTGICMYKELSLALRIPVDHFIYRRDLVVYLVEVEIVRQSDMTIDVQVRTILLRTEIVYVYPGVSPVLLHTINNIFHQAKVTLIH